ncbi:MAG: hypothetical protein JNM89_06170 [Hyphomicrobiaceae bacterium]|nr:hypothetical protein [Hyphomicrobiaceae bacterium]
MSVLDLVNYRASVEQHRDGYWLFYQMGDILPARRLPDEAAARAMQTRLDRLNRPLLAGLGVGVLCALSGLLAAATAAALIGLGCTIALPTFYALGLAMHTPDSAERAARGLALLPVATVLAVLIGGTLFVLMR